MSTKAKTPKTPAPKRQEFDLPALIERFGSEDRCREYLEGLRWPNGVECPRCQSKKISRVEKRKVFDCSSCGYQFSVRVGTVFHDSHLPLWKWFLAVYLICESKKGVSANQLKRTLGVAYKTAWYLCHRIRSAMTQEGTLLSGVVEADETYLGGRKKMGKGHPSRWGNDWREGKAVVLGALERDGKLRLRHVPNARKHNVHRFLKDVLDDEAKALYTDSFQSYRSYAFGETTKHEHVSHAKEEWVRGDVHTNGIESAWSLFDRAVIGAYHKLSHKHLPAYLDEFAFRFNNRENPYLFRDTILRLIKGDSLSYEDLIAD